MRHHVEIDQSIKVEQTNQPTVAKKDGSRVYYCDLSASGIRVFQVMQLRSDRLARNRPRTNGLGGRIEANTDLTA